MRKNSTVRWVWEGRRRREEKKNTKQRKRSAGNGGGGGRNSGSDFEIGDEDDLLKVPHLKRELRNNSGELQAKKGTAGPGKGKRPREAQSLDPVWRKTQKMRKANPGLSQRKKKVTVWEKLILFAKTFTPEVKKVVEIDR